MKPAGISGLASDTHAGKQVPMVSPLAKISGSLLWSGCPVSHSGHHGGLPGQPHVGEGSEGCGQHPPLAHMVELQGSGYPSPLKMCWPNLGGTVGMPGERAYQGRGDRTLKGVQIRARPRSAALLALAATQTCVHRGISFSHKQALQSNEMNENTHFTQRIPAAKGQTDKLPQVNAAQGKNSGKAQTPGLV